MQNKCVKDLSNQDLVDLLKRFRNHWISERTGMSRAVISAIIHTGREIRVDEANRIKAAIFDHCPRIDDHESE